MDSKPQGLIEEAIRALGQGDVAMARTFIAQAHEIDRSLSALADVVYLACAELEEEGVVSMSTWNTLADAVGPGALLGVVEASRP